MSEKISVRDRRRLVFWLWVFVAAVVVYVLSSGPVMATAFLLREATGWDGFYLVMWIYYPLLLAGHDNLIINYIEWWVEQFGAVGPG